MQQNQNFTDHKWIEEDKMVASTIDGDLYIVESNECKQYIENGFMSDDAMIGVSIIKPYSKGFLLCSDTGYMALWVRSEENNSTSGKQLYDFIRKW